MVKQKKQAEAEAEAEEEKELLCLSDFRGIRVEDSLSSWDKLVLVTLKVAKHKWEENLNYKSSKKISDNKKQQPTTTPLGAATSLTLPDEMLSLIRKMDGEEILPLIEKCLNRTDINKGEHRLLMPMNKIISTNFLTQEERDQLLLKNAKGGHMDIKVLMIHPNNQHTGQPQLLSLKRWDMRKDTAGRGTINYVLTGAWLHVVASNNLQAGDLIQIWTFRVALKLHLLLLILQRAQHYQHDQP